MGSDKSNEISLILQVGGPLRIATANQYPH